jgi:hypothetical protein
MSRDRKKPLTGSVLIWRDPDVMIHLRESYVSGTGTQRSHMKLKILPTDEGFIE